jgi:hypothetical protein
MANESSPILSQKTLHLFFRIGLDIIPYHDGIEAFNHSCRIEIVALINELNICYNDVLSPNPFIRNGMPNLPPRAKDRIFFSDRNRFSGF